jgi:hypothetical protein
VSARYARRPSATGEGGLGALRRRASEADSERGGPEMLARPFPRGLWNARKGLQPHSSGKCRLVAGGGTRPGGRVLTARSAPITMPRPRSSNHHLFGPLPGTAHTSFTLESCLGIGISVDETPVFHRRDTSTRWSHANGEFRHQRPSRENAAARPRSEVRGTHRCVAPSGCGQLVVQSWKLLRQLLHGEIRTGGRAPARRPRRIALSTSCPMRRTTEGDDIARSQTDCGMDDDGSRIRCESRNRTVAA